MTDLGSGKYLTDLEKAINPSCQLENETGQYNLFISSSYLLLYLLQPNSVACKMETACSFEMSEQT
jgi:hypothetical protein